MIVTKVEHELMLVGKPRTVLTGVIGDSNIPARRTLDHDAIVEVLP